MNNNNLNMNTNYTMGENGVITQNEPITYDSYYNHQPRKSPWPIIIIIAFVIISVAVSLWLAGAFTPMDRQAEYNKLYARVCSAAIKYSNTKHATAKAIPGKIVYVTVAELSDANMIEAAIRNYITNEPIPASTNIRLEVLPNKTFQCHGFLSPGDDTIKPIITLKGDATIYSAVGAKVTDPGATAIDDKDGDISDLISRSGSVNINQPGTYIISYIVSDRSGNVSDIVKRTYIIQ